MTTMRKSKIVESLSNIIFGKNESLDDEARKRIEDEIKEVVSELESLKSNYHYASEEMIDYYSYQILAAEIKYKYLFKKLRKYEASNY